MYTIQLQNNSPLMLWDPGLEILHVAAIAVDNHTYDAQLMSSDTILVVGIDHNNRGAFHLMDGDKDSIIRKYRGLVNGVGYTLHVWDTVQRFNDLKQAMGL